MGVCVRAWMNADTCRVKVLPTSHLRESEQHYISHHLSIWWWVWVAMVAFKSTEKLSAVLGRNPLASIPVLLLESPYFRVILIHHVHSWKRDKWEVNDSLECWKLISLHGGNSQRVTYHCSFTAFPVLNTLWLLCATLNLSCTRKKCRWMLFSDIVITPTNCHIIKHWLIVSSMTGL